MFALSWKTRGARSRIRWAAAGLVLLFVALAGGPVPGVEAQERGEGDPEEPHFATFSIAAVDPETGESGVAVTTRVTCVGNVVPWVRAGVGAVATQAWTRLEYGPELLDLLEDGEDPEAALEARVDADDDRERRQVGVVGVRGGGAQFTGQETMEWAGHRSGEHHVVQGNLLVGAEVVEAVDAAFEESEGSGRHLADRLVAALEAGQAVGGDARSGRLQSAAVVVADPREGRASRPDGVTAHLNVCEHPEPVAELRRQHDAVAGVLGHRELQRYSGSDVVQLKLILNALGHYRPEADLEEIAERDDRTLLTEAAAGAVDRAREELELSTPAVGTPSGFVDAELVDALWTELDDRGRAEEVREVVRDLTAIRR